MSFASMKKKSNLDDLLGAAQKESSPQDKKSYKDERLWKPTMDKTDNGYAVIRFLPASEGEDLPWVKIWNHAFQGPTGQWYIENSLTTLSQSDPVSEYNSKLWNSGVESDKEIARKQKRKLQYYSNIYVVTDSAHPENEGKVFLYRYGKKIFDKVMEAMQPAFQDEVAINPFDFWNGANFKLKLRKVDGYWNYDKSEFSAPSALLEDDGELENVYKKIYPLSEFTASTNFKSYEELKNRFELVLSGVTAVYTVATLMEDEPTASVKIDTKAEPNPVPAVSDDDEDDAMSYFQKLAEEA
jgi:hypothetical protein|tara:strand:+ start:2307 stop:3200 length:894 start_codon:yes stop_codon:yes gene_type:complete